MSATDAQKDALKDLAARWTDLRRVLDDGGASACCDVLASEPDDATRIQAFKLAIRKLGGGAGASTADLDAMIAIGDAAISNAIETGVKLGNEAHWTDQANVLAYNLSANLCDCWGDGESRRTRHFETGLRYANQALEFRRQLKKGPGPFSMAYWAQGKHLLSLGRASEAVAAFRSSLDAEESMAQSAALNAASGSLLNSRAFLGIALKQSGQPDGDAMIEESLAALRYQAEHGEGEAREDAAVYIDQITQSRTARRE